MGEAGALVKTGTEKGQFQHAKGQDEPKALEQEHQPNHEGHPTDAHEKPNVIAPAKGAVGLKDDRALRAVLIELRGHHG